MKCPVVELDLMGAGERLLTVALTGHIGGPEARRLCKDAAADGVLLQLDDFILCDGLDL